ncbi:MAG: transposase [candidate division Zixibacteria bacterium]|nr:transposase [candidate division Zixibacteria bacterium]
MVFVTTTVKKWTPVFANKRYGRLVVDMLREVLSRHQVSLAAYVLMPSHFHALMGFKEITQLPRMMQTFKSLSTRRLRPILSDELRKVFEEDGAFRLWKPRFDDLVIWSDKQFKIKINYIHNNPVKAGLVGRSTEYIMSSSGDWILGEQGLISIDKNWSWLN